MHLQAGVLADEHTRGSGMVEVDVRKKQVPDIRQRQALLGQALLQRRDARRGPAVLQREPVVGLQQVDADHALVAEVMQVERIRGRHLPRILGGFRPWRRRGSGAAS